MKSFKIIDALLWVLRIVVGGLFIFSGLVKANDPSGLSYKMQEFFEVWANQGYLPQLMHFLSEYTLPFSIAMIIFEIVAGVALIIGYRFKLFSYLILLLTIFFTFLTAYALFSGRIKECGCFGDCIKLKPIETFYKDVVLLILITIILFFRKRIHDLFSFKIGTLIIILVFLASWGIQAYVLKHLPFKDCLAYKAGNNLLKEMTPSANYKPAEYASEIYYKNLQSGEKKAFAANNLPWQDTLHWKYDTTLSTLIHEAINEPAIKDFLITDYNGNDITQTLLNYPDHLFLLFIKNVTEAHTENINALRSLIEECKKINLPIIALSASTDIETNAFAKQHHLDIPFAILDGTACKTAMRCNPGLMLLQKGNVVHKWSYLDYPTLTSLKMISNKIQAPLFPTVDSSRSSE